MAFSRLPYFLREPKAGGGCCRFGTDAKKGRRWSCVVPAAASAPHGFVGPTSSAGLPPSGAGDRGGWSRQVLCESPGEVGRMVRRKDTGAGERVLAGGWLGGCPVWAGGWRWGAGSAGPRGKGRGLEVRLRSVGMWWLRGARGWAASEAAVREWHLGCSPRDDKAQGVGGQREAEVEATGPCTDQQPLPSLLLRHVPHSGDLGAQFLGHCPPQMTHRCASLPASYPQARLPLACERGPTSADN